MISILFILNSLTGILSAIGLADGDSITTQDLQPGDFKFDPSNQSIDFTVEINNKFKYDLENIKIQMAIIFTINDSLHVNYGNEYVILNVSNIDLGADPEGQTIKAGEKAEIGITCDNTTADWTFNEFLLDYLGVTLPPWDIVTPIQNGDIIGRIEVDFSVSYAFGQYELEFNMVVGHEQIKAGLV